MSREKYGNLFWGLHYHFLYDKRRSMAVDIGGCAGTYSQMYSCLFDNVTVFEPNENWIDKLHTVADNVEVINTGLWNKETELQFYKVDKTDGMPRGLSTFKQIAIDDLKNYPPNFILREPETVNVKPLDSYNLSDASFIKIDTEGAEHDVIEGMQETLKNFKPKIMLEKHPTMIPKNISLKDIDNVLKKNKYKSTLISNSPIAIREMWTL